MKIVYYGVGKVGITTDCTCKIPMLFVCQLNDSKTWQDVTKIIGHPKVRASESRHDNNKNNKNNNNNSNNKNNNDIIIIIVIITLNAFHPSFFFASAFVFFFCFFSFL